MADKTTNYNLNKPLKTENVNIDILNQNMDMIDNAINLKADTESPTFTGTPKASTASDGTNTTQIATTAFTQTAVSNHNTANTAHTDIRDLITELTNRLNALADSDDTALDQLSEIAAYVKSNRTLIESVTANKADSSHSHNNLLPVSPYNSTYSSLADFYTHCNSVFKSTASYIVMGRAKLASFVPEDNWYRYVVSAQNLLGNNSYDVTGSIIIDNGVNLYYGKISGGKTDTSDLYVKWYSFGTATYYCSTEPTVYTNNMIWIE